MTTQRKPLYTHVITLLFVLFQFIQFFPSSLVSSLTASAETSNAISLFSDDKGSGNAKWSLSEDGKLITWEVTVTQNESEAEAAPSVEVVVPEDVGAPQLVSATPTGVFNTSGNSHTFTAPYSTTAQTLTLTFTTAVNDISTTNLTFKIGASIQQKDSPAAAALQSVSIPNKLAQLEAERIAAEKAEAERIAAEKAEAERIAAEEKAAQEEADRLAEEQRLAEEAAKLEEAELETEQSAESEAPVNESSDKESISQEAAPEEEAVSESDVEVDAEVEDKTNEEPLSTQKVQEESVEEDVAAAEPDDITILSGGSYSIDFSAYDTDFYDFNLPFDYPTPPSGRAADPMGTPSAETVESLQPENLALGQIVPFEAKISVTGTTSPEDGVMQFTAGWETVTTNGSNFGFDPNYMVFAGFVDTVDSTDPGNDATVYDIDAALVGTEIQGTFYLSGMDTGDTIIVEMWVVLKDTLPEKVGNTVQTRLISAETATGDTINTGNQTVPLNQTSTFTSVEADVSIIKSDEPDPLYVNETLTYTITVTNNSTDTVANGIVVEDTLDPYVTFVSASDGGVHSGADIDGSGGTVTWPAFALEPEDSRVFILTVTVDEDAPTDNFLGTTSDDRGDYNDDGIPLNSADLLNFVVIASMITDDPNPANDMWYEPTNVLPRLSVEARKDWVGGRDEDHVAVELILSRSIDDVNYEIVDIDPMITPDSGTSSRFDYIWSDLPQYDTNGIEYIYEVTEELVLDNYNSEVTYDEEFGIWIVTNTFESPLIDIEAAKIWDGGPEADHVAVDLILSRSIDGETYDIVDLDPMITPDSGTSTRFDYIWSDLPQYDFNGNEYLYRVTEELELDNYTSESEFIDGVWIVTNTYTSPLIPIVGEKIWANDTPEHRPETLTISLYRMIEGGEPEYVTETTTSALDEWFYDFGEQDETDNDGNVYTYSIEETVPPNYNEEYAAPYYVEDVLHLDVENTLVMGDLYILKTDMDGNPILDNPAEFKLTRIDPEVADPFTVTLSTDAEGKLVFTDLLAGTYLLEETKAPLGFNLYPNDFVITIEKGENGETIVNVEEVQITEENPLTIKNRPSQSLPDTGSMGTTIFTVLGIALMGGAVYGLKKKKSKQS
ncbi:LPXTG-motif cell wall anchor domain-containing protein/conserved repeat domain-containing protein [Alkalibacterium subtropicum]|uniref:LPXTG-motif cell wall anchor domain-containing protein/conserved repeat domain-containing protein n=1 Tax=Alkalibacterium subtropicum TaxID=753702 RepID=A0A1I1JPV3_9LACT|nr:Cna B-type domain-containing protein [Alkalibacterium subtropicum]SFC47913.1 LPXTG-motif cell wall anchor domain-containing protein/conserved repeat domain-containing protein [Alkalibacterium subtropicum]